MCGIAGIWRRDGGNVDATPLTPMLTSIVHRGPDDRGIWYNGPVALGQQRLTIIDLSQGSHQPMLTSDELGVLVYNGEVYNYLELRNELEREGISFHSEGDTEVVLQALHHWGPKQALPRFNGMFGLAYLNRRDNTLWLARDRIGIKPMVVADTGSELLFASEVKALLAHPSMKRKIDDRALTMRLMGRHSASHQFLFEGVEGIEAGTWWRVSKSGIEKHRYFHVLDDLDVERLVAAADADPHHSVDAFSAAMRKSVKLHLASDVPLAAMVSGGVDSSLVAAYMREHQPDLQGYVADVAWSGGEGDQAERVGHHLGMKVNRVRIDRELYLRLWPSTIWHHDGVPFHPSDPALLAVTQRCHEDGIKVLLTGEGSDELFGGYPWYPQTWQHWNRLYGPLHRLLPKKRLAKKRLILSETPFSNIMGRSRSTGRRMIISMDANTELLPNRILELLASIEPAADRGMLANSLADLYGHMSWILFRHDRIGMAASMEMRVPFLENGMFDLAFHLPKRTKLHRKTCKWIVKKESERHLPKDVVYAKKKGFPIPDTFTSGTQRLLNDGLLAQRFRWASATQRDIMFLAAGDDLLRYHLVGMEMWLRLFFGDENCEDLGEKLLSAAGSSRMPQGLLTDPS